MSEVNNQSSEGIRLTSFGGIRVLQVASQIDDNVLSNGKLSTISLLLSALFHTSVFSFPN